MIINIKNRNIFNNIRNTESFEFSDSERFNRVLSFLELPFFFDNELYNFYRFEASAYNFNYELIYRNFSVDLNLGLKVKTKLLMSMFMKLPSNKTLFDKKFSTRTTFLLNNSFFLQQVNLLKKNDIKFSNDYFNISLNTLSLKNFYNISYELSDISLDLLSSHNKFNRVSNINMYDVDTFISTFNYNWFSFQNDNYSLSNIVVVNDNLRTFSFLVSSLDSFKLIHPKYFTKYLYFKKVINNSRINKRLQLFKLLFNKNYYLYIYNYLYKRIDIFFFKNLNYINSYKYIFKFIIYLIVNNFNLIINNFVLFKFFYINFFFKLLNKNYYIFSNYLVKKLKNFLILLHSGQTVILNKSLVLTNKIFFKKSNTKFYHSIKFSHFLNNRYSLLNKLTNKKCYHAHSIHYQPSEIFYSASRLGYTFSSILYTTNFKNLKGSFYTQKAVSQYYKFLKFFSDFILSFLKRNFIKSIIYNFYYNPKYLFFKYFTVFKLVFPLIFKKWALKKINYKNLSLSSNFLNYFLLNKNKRFIKNNKKLVKNQINSLNNLYINNKKIRFYSTSVSLKTDSLAKYPDFLIILNFFFSDLLKNINYMDLLFILPRFNNFNKIISNFVLNYFYFSIFCLYSKFRVEFSSFFFYDLLSIDCLYFVDYKFLTVFETISNKLDVNLFYKTIFTNIIRFNDFILKIDFYTFIILKRYIEYFRIFKYNEYISYNKFNKYDHFIEDLPDFSFLPSFYSFKKSLFFNKYLIYKTYNLKINLKQQDKHFFSSVLLNSIFFKFFILFFSVKKFFNLFSSFFLYYLNNGIYLYIYKSLIKSQSFSQKICIKHLNDFYTYSHNLLNYTNNQMYNQLKTILLNDLGFINYNYLKGLNFVRDDLNLYSSFTIILLNDYVDEFFYMYLLNYECLNYSETLNFIKSMISRSSFNFVNIKYSLNSRLLNFNLFKKHVDVLIWQIYSTAIVSTYYPVYLNDLYLFIQKLNVDNIFRFNCNSFNIMFSHLNLNFNRLLNYFLMYIFSKDFFFKFLEKFCSFLYFNNTSLFFQYNFYLKLLQFNNLFLIQSKFNYLYNYILFFKTAEFNYFV